MAKEVAGELPQEASLTIEEIKGMLRNAESRRLGGGLPQMKTTVPIACSGQISTSRLPKLRNLLKAEPYLTIRSGVAHVDSAKISKENERRLADQTPSSTVNRPIEKPKVKGRKSDAGPDWFHLPRTEVTSELKRDLQLLRMRSTWDPKRHYKSDNRRPLIPEYAQVGNILEGPTEYYSSRISKHDRKRSFVEQVLNAEEGSSRFKSRYADIQSSKASGRRAHYDQLKQQRSKRFPKF
ncbi:MAG: hypothetical protein Q9170_006405 [Blastenia crenularia]